MTSSPREDANILTNVKDYYGKQLQCTADLKTQACVSTATNVQPPRVKAALAEIHEEVKKKLEVAKRYIGYHTEKFGYQKENVRFVQGYMEKLSEAGIESNSLDVIVSNCSVNLSPDKHAVLSEAYRVLKVGGEMYFSDIYADQVLSDKLRKHDVLWGEGMSGALCWEELHTIAESVGFSTPRLVKSSLISIDREDFKQVLGDIKYVAATYRLFKLPNDRTQTGQVVYKGGITWFESQIDLDQQTQLKTGEVRRVDPELRAFLQSSRFKDDFVFQSGTQSGERDSQCCSTKVNPFKMAANRK